MLSYILIALIAIFILANSPLLPDIQPKEYSVPLPDSLDGPLSINNRLNDAEKLFEEQLVWPESLAEYKGSIYTGIADGRIVQISKDKIHPTAQIGKKCEGSWQEHICGRPLGMKFDSKGQLHALDAYYGYHIIDVKTGAVKPIFQSPVSIVGKQMKFFNDLAIDEEENAVYITVSSSKWPLYLVLFSVFEHESSGCLLKHDVIKNETVIIYDNLNFPNGMVLSHDKKSLIIAEGNNHRILKYHIKGPKKGKTEVLLENLPGEPDNVRHSKRGGYWVGINSARNISSQTLYDQLARYPIIKKGILQLQYIIGSSIMFVSKYLPWQSVKEVAFEVATGRILVDILPTHGLIVEFNDNGEIIQSLHSPDGKISHISEVLEHNGYLYLGSWRNHYLGRLKF